MSYDTISLKNNPECPFGDLHWTGYYWKRTLIEPEYEEDYWGTVEDPDGVKRNFSDEWERRVEDKQNVYDFLNQVSPGKILDVGCGPGIFLSGLNQGWECYGNDISKMALDHCAKYGKTIHGELPKLELNPDIYDVVSMQHVIEHLSNPIEYIDRIKEILKNDGILILATPDFDSACARHFKNEFRMLHDKGHISLFTTHSLINLLEDKGFEIIKIDYPFFDTRWFTKENLLRMFDTTKVSPPFYGSHVVIFCRNIKQ